MNLFLPLTTLLLVVITPALCSLEHLAQLPACTASLTNQSVCGTGPSYTNDIFTCTNGTWTLNTTCASANAPCSHGACTPLARPCIPGTTQCASLRAQGYQGVAVCRAGSWDMRQACACLYDDGGRARCVAGANTATTQGCKEGELKCLARDYGGGDGAVYRCNGIGLWRIVQDCSRYERCVDRPVPHCTWA